MAARQSRTNRRMDAAAADLLGRAAAATRVGDTETALSLLLLGVRKTPEAEALYGPLTRLLAPMRFNEASPAAIAAVEQTLRSPYVDPQPLAPAAISLLRARYGFDASALPDAFTEDALTLTLLERVLLPDLPLERMLTVFRRTLLADLRDDPSRERRRFAVALAAQALLNVWMWAETAEEAEAVDALADELGGEAAFDFRHVVFALYRPLADLPNAAAIASAAKGPWRDAAERLLAEPLEERRLAGKLPTLSRGPDHATAAVKDQYEAFPYPRWTITPRRRPRPIREAARAMFPERVTDVWPAWPDAGLDVMIAGCGAGKHAADVATRFRGARILAIDLSRTALGYAARKLRGRADIEFAEADIMALDGFERRFDHIESVGVLHHLADPLGGWRNLVGLLKPSGSMRVGFYSQRGRTRIQAAREALATAGYHGRDPDDLRRARAHAAAAAADHPARLAAGELDFYAASGARDFLFHAHEIEYRPGELAEMTEALGLEVLGLELTDPAAAGRYQRRFPDDPAMADLRRWDAVEAEWPDTFRHMCQFWAAKPVQAD